MFVAVTVDEAGALAGGPSHAGATFIEVGGLVAVDVIIAIAICVAGTLSGISANALTAVVLGCTSARNAIAVDKTTAFTGGSTYTVTAKVDACTTARHARTVGVGRCRRFPTCDK